MQHNITGTLFHSIVDCSLNLYINSDLVYTNNFTADTKYNLDIAFDYKYKCNKMHELIIDFDSTDEVEKKYICIDSLKINDQSIPIANAFYRPRESEWWKSNNAFKEKSVYKHGSYFGWCGKIHFYYYINTVKFDSWQNALGITDKIIFSDARLTRGGFK